MCVFCSWPFLWFHSSEMMAHPNLLPEVDVSILGPLFSVDTVNYLEETYLGKVQVSRRARAKVVCS